MPLRKISFEIGNFYHIFNRGIADSRTFFNKHDYTRFMLLVKYYQYANQPMSFSHLINLKSHTREIHWIAMQTKKDYQVRIHSYCLMPNHFHFLIREHKESGIQTFIRKLINAYTKYINMKYNRFGPLFSGRFQAVPVKTDEQLLHLSRYIHLNPITSFLIEQIKDLKHYPWSSYPVFIGEKVDEITETKEILNHFKSQAHFIQFTQDQIDYQRYLAASKKKFNTRS